MCALAKQIKQWGKALGFQQVGISDIELEEHETHLLNWLDRHYHGDMDYMQRHGTKRSQPQQLVPGTARIISVRMDYWPAQAAPADTQLDDSVASRFLSLVQSAVCSTQNGLGVITDLNFGYTETGGDCFSFEWSLRSLRQHVPNLLGLLRGRRDVTVRALHDLTTSWALNARREASAIQ